MTEENYNYRTSQKLLRNQFPGKGKLKIPIIPKFQESPGDFDDLLLIGFDKTHLEDQNHLDRMVHFFLYDYRFERVWKNPDNDIEKLSRYRAVLSPDFSMYLEMAPVMQLYNVFRNRWCGAYWASKGLRVIPTVNWGDESTFDFCFEGIEKGSVVAVSTYMASEHDNRCDQKEWFMAGYNEMLRRIEPEKIICYNTPFPEMQGNIIHVDYERSSWRYMNYERSFHREDLDAFKIGGTSSNNRDTIEPYLIGKGGGSVYGGEIKPSKPEDERFWGEPGETKYIVCGVSHALHGVFVRNTNGQHSGGIDVAEVVETEVWDTAFLADAGEPGVDGFPGHVDNAVSAAGLPVQQFPDVGRDMERSCPAVCFCAFLGGAILSQNDCPTDFQSVAINVPPFQT